MMLMSGLQTRSLKWFTKLSLLLRKANHQGVHSNCFKYSGNHILKEQSSLLFHYFLKKLRLVINSFGLLQSDILGQQEIYT